MAVLAWSGLLRAGELVGLQRQDICFFTDHHSGHKVLSINIRSSKTNWAPDQVLIRVTGWVQHFVLPYIIARGTSSGPLWRQDPAGRPVSASCLAAWLRANLPPGVDPAAVSLHSFRRGGTTQLFLEGVPEAVIRAHGRWKSLEVRRYFDSRSLPGVATTAVLSGT
jgi:hypothetical protein